MVLFKRNIQALNRIAVPEEIMNSLNLRIGDSVYMTCDSGSRMMYIAPAKKTMPHLVAVFDKVVFDRDKGITTPIVKDTEKKRYIIPIKKDGKTVPFIVHNKTSGFSVISALGLEKEAIKNETKNS